LRYERKYGIVFVVSSIEIFLLLGFEEAILAWTETSINGSGSMRVVAMQVKG